MTPPTTPSTSGGHRSQNININQKLDLLLSMFMEQKKTVDDTKATTDALQKHVLSLSTEVTEVKTKVESMSSISTSKRWGNQEKNSSATLGKYIYSPLLCCWQDLHEM